MKMQRIILAACLSVLVSCQQHPGIPAQAPAKDTTAAVMTKTDTVKRTDLSHVKIANENDPVCGMPLLRGFEDTATYKGKLVGFCSKECKEDFLKKPKSYKLVTK